MTGPKYCGCSVHRDAHGDCDSVCAANGCLPAMTDAASSGRRFGAYGPLDEFQPPARPAPVFHEPSPHPKTIRAAALMAAANMLAGSAGAHPHESTVSGWEARVLRTAQRFEHYINGTTTESEDSDD